MVRFYNHEAKKKKMHLDLPPAQNNYGNCNQKGEDVRIDFKGVAPYLKLGTNQGIAAKQVFIEFGIF
jgi:TPR repeat protein